MLKTHDDVICCDLIWFAFVKHLFAMTSTEKVSHLKQHGQRVTSLALFSDDVHALSVSRDRSLICWDLRSESQVGFMHHDTLPRGKFDVPLYR